MAFEFACVTSLREFLMNYAALHAYVNIMLARIAGMGNLPEDCFGKRNGVGSKKNAQVVVLCYLNPDFVSLRFGVNDDHKTISDGRISFPGHDRRGYDLCP